MAAFPRLSLSGRLIVKNVKKHQKLTWQTCIILGQQWHNWMQTQTARCMDCGTPTCISALFCVICIWKIDGTETVGGRRSRKKYCDFQSPPKPYINLYFSWFWGLMVSVSFRFHCEFQTGSNLRSVFLIIKTHSTMKGLTCK